MRYGRRERKKLQQPTLAPIKSIIGPCLTIILISRTPGTEVPDPTTPYILMMFGRIQGQT